MRILAGEIIGTLTFSHILIAVSGKGDAQNYICEVK